MVLTENKKAYFDYEVLEKLEAGIVLTGQEVKSRLSLDWARERKKQINGKQSKNAKRKGA